MAVVEMRDAASSVQAVAALYFDGHAVWNELLAVAVLYPSGRAVWNGLLAVVKAWGWFQSHPADK